MTTPMASRCYVVGVVATALSLSLVTSGQTPPPGACPAAGSGVARAVRTVVDALPLRFEENEGQFDPRVAYVARTNRASVFLSEDGATLSLDPTDSPGTTLTLRVVGGRPRMPRALEPTPTRTHYIHGRDPSHWVTDVPTFARVEYASVLDGVDLVFHGRVAQLEYDFILAPGVDPSMAVLAIDGA